MRALKSLPRRAAALLLLTLSVLQAGAAFAEDAALETRRLSDRMLFIQGPDANVLAVHSSEGLILVDGGHADWYGSLRATLEEHFPGVPVRALFNTQWHPEQVGANIPLAAEGVEIIAHENTMLWLGTEVEQRWSEHVYPPLPAPALPRTTFLEDGSIQLGDREVRYGYLMNAHTDGDIWVYFAEEDVLVTGGLVSNGRWPEIDWWTGGYIGGMLDSFVTLLTVPGADTTIVPAYGPPMTLDELKAQNQMYLTIFDRLHRLFIDSNSLDEVLAAGITAEYDAQMGDPTLFVTLAYQSLLGRLRDPQNFRMLNFP